MKPGRSSKELKSRAMRSQSQFSLQETHKNIPAMPKGVLFVTEDQKIAIRKQVNLNDQQLKNCIEIILDWYKKQQHLPRIDLDRRMIECILITRKGSVEQTKQKIDMMFTLRNVIPELATPRDILNPRLQKSLQGCVFVPLPKLNKDYTRISVLKYRRPEHFNLTDLAILVCMLAEYRLINDYFAGERFLIDLSGFTLSHLTKYSAAVCKHAEIYVRKAYGMRMFGIHIVNGSNIFNKLVAILKAGLSSKLGSRIYVHAENKDMYNVIDQEILPFEYGGKERSIDELAEDWVEELAKEENRKFLIANENLRSNESLRIGNKLDDELLGVAGTFRKLEVD